MRAGIALLLGLAVLAPACAARRTVEMDTLRQKLEEMAQKQEGSDRRVEELNNRVFLLEDKVDTSRVALLRRGERPQLPVIRLRPGRPDEVSTAPASQRLDVEGSPRERWDGETDARAQEDDSSGQRRSSLVEERSVSYSGAARAVGPRPLLRLHGTAEGGPGDSVRHAPAGSRSQGPGPDPALVTEKLPLAPLPKPDVARRASRGEVVPMKDYQSALAMYRAGEVPGAADAFRSFVSKYSTHAYADNALYWLGECFYDMQNYRFALKMFRRVIEEYPDGNKAPDALLKMGFSYLKLNETGNARTVLAQLVGSFPDSQVARLASQTLVKIQ